MANIDPQKVETILREAAATYIRPRFRKLQKHEVSTKSGPNDLVSVADTEAEEFLERALPAAFPGFSVIGEEGVSKKRVASEALKDHSRMLFVCDPVDGTTNFVEGREMFCTMLACVAHGEVIGAWIYDIMKDRMMTAEKGGGAYMDGVRLSVAAEKPYPQTLGHIALRFIPQPMRPYVKNIEKETRGIESLFCAGHEYLRLTAGESDFAVYSKIRPWDHLPGTLAVKEAGGHVMKWNNTPYVPGDEFGGLVVASTASLLQELQQRATSKMVNEYNKRIL